MVHNNTLSTNNVESLKNLPDRMKRKVKRWLEVYESTQSVTLACKASKLHLATYYNYYDKFPDFKNQIELAEQRVFDEAYKFMIKKSKVSENAAKFILQRDKRFQKQEKTQDNRKIIINYPNWQ